MFAALAFDVEVDAGAAWRVLDFDCIRGVSAMVRACQLMLLRSEVLEIPM